MRCIGRSDGDAVERKKAEKRVILKMKTLVEMALELDLSDRSGKLADGMALFGYKVIRSAVAPKVVVGHFAAIGRNGEITVNPGKITTREVCEFEWLQLRIFEIDILDSRTGFLFSNFCRSCDRVPPKWCLFWQSAIISWQSDR